MKFPGPLHEAELLVDLTPARMLELGSKQFGAYKRYFEEQGWRHTSVDLNGEGGALPLDLQRPFNLGHFDVVTNFGTTEHVESQEPVWRNIHDALEVGGYLLSTVPYPGDWVGHGRWYPPDGWYADFCELNGYEMELLDIVGLFQERRRMIRLRARKAREQPFRFPPLPIYDSGAGKVGCYR